MPCICIKIPCHAVQHVWATMGTLSADGFVLQLKLHRLGRAKHRDPVTGDWFAYCPCGGGVTRIDRGDASLTGMGNPAYTLRFSIKRADIVVMMEVTLAMLTAPSL